MIDLYRVCGLMSALLLAGCLKAPPDSTETGALDVTDVTSVTEYSSMQGASQAGAGEPSRQSDENRGELVQTYARDESVQASPLDLTPPQPEENSDHLFAESDKGPNFFTAPDKKKGEESIKLKGKLYMIEEPSPEKNLQNLDGGEIGITVPLK